MPNWLHTEDPMLGPCFWRFQLPEEEIAPLEAKRVLLAEAASARAPTAS